MSHIIRKIKAAFRGSDDIPVADLYTLRARYERLGLAELLAEVDDEIARVR